MKLSLNCLALLAAAPLATSAYAFSAEDFARLFTNSDTNTDGVIEFAETVRALNLDHTTFSRADVNDDGTLSVDEYANVLDSLPPDDPMLSALMDAAPTVSDNQAPLYAQPEGRRSLDDLGYTKESVDPEEQIEQSAVSHNSPATALEPYLTPPPATPLDGTADDSTVSRTSPATTSDGNLSGLDEGIAAKKAGEMKGMTVENLNNDLIGEVDKVVVNPVSRELYAIVTTSGFLGMDEQQVALSLNTMQISNGRLLASTWSGGGELVSTKPYAASLFQDVQDNRLLKELAAELRS